MKEEKKVILIDNPSNLELYPLDSLNLFQGDLKLEPEFHTLGKLMQSIIKHHVFIGKAIFFEDNKPYFDKKAIALTFDEADNFNDRRTIVYARNACFQIAKDLGIKYFMQLDDDYTEFSYKVEINGALTDRKIYNLDYIFELLLKYYKKIPALSVAMAQGGDFIGGKHNIKWKNGFTVIRKCMNTFICSVDRPFTFVGRINEDVNTYVLLGGRGKLFLTIPDVKISQKTTQNNPGGMTDIYLDKGTYIKSFYTILFAPSCVKIGIIGTIYPRLHHHISWKNAVPVIIDEKYKK